MHFSTLTGTRAEDSNSMPGFSPDWNLRWHRLKPGILHPGYQLTHDMAETLLEIFVWLHLCRAHFYAEARNEEWRKHCAAQIKTDNGDGI
jgi:hypothetical protein